jgi:tetratricopeptide (TPR) repeat protein
LAFKKVIQLDPKNIDAWIDYSNFLFDNTSKSTAINEVKKAIKSNDNQVDLKLRLVAMQISTGNLSEAKSNLSEMQNSDQNIFKKLIDIYPEVLQVKEMNKFFQPYKDNPNK